MGQKRIDGKVLPRALPRAEGCPRSWAPVTKGPQTPVCWPRWTQRRGDRKALNLSATNLMEAHASPGDLRGEPAKAGHRGAIADDQAADETSRAGVARFP